MKVFLSWSGERSQEIASALRHWLRFPLQTIEPWMSGRDISPGQRWGNEVASQLSVSDFGIICVTPENLDSRWLHFEAGALAQSVDSGRVVPLLYEVKSVNLEGPLSQFQSVEADRVGLKRLVLTLHALEKEKRIEESVVSELFDRTWDMLASTFTKLASANKATGPQQRPDRELLEEIVEAVRDLRRREPSGATQPKLQSAEGLLRTEIERYTKQLAQYEDAQDRLEADGKEVPASLFDVTESARSYLGRLQHDLRLLGR